MLCEADSSENITGIEPKNTAQINPTDNNQHLSKKQLRKLKKREKIERLRPIKRKEEKERLKQRRAEARERGEILGPTRKTLKSNTMKDSQCQLRVVIDCSFDCFMTDKAINSLTQQIQRCYSINRRAQDPLQFHVCGVDGKTKDRMESIGDYVNWDVYFKSEPYTDCFHSDEIVYLTSESENIITELDVNKVYIIGGLVDHNKEKGLCYKLAVEKGLSHAQLPISEFIEMKTRKVLTIDHVFEILLRFEETKNWEEAFFKVLPKRKRATLKSIMNSTDQNEGESEEQEQRPEEQKVTQEQQLEERKETDGDKTINSKNNLDNSINDSVLSDICTT
ncbi:tRNA methyltransferase 10 homolog A-like [Tubulanus polymorphus]|uniref:tRNA methyltransferase 10 homolog A-like n=1 Tax=Tubulanus polymorphus TaxID=672921 RepID=UPI003DA23971